MEKKVCIIYNTSKEDAINFYKISKDFFIKKGFTLTTNVEESEFVVVIGGDGTLLRASKEIAKHDKFAIAINMGSLGFLTDIKTCEALKVFEDTLKGDYKLEERFMLEVEVKEKIYIGLNEVVLIKGGIVQNLIKISAMGGKNFINTYRADGLIIATPTGSTGYSLSAGGPIITPCLNLLVLTPIAPHNLSIRPILVRGDEELTLKLENEDRIAYVTIDGDEITEITPEDLVKVRTSKKKLKLLIPKSRDYYSVLREKLKWGDNIC